MLNFPAKKISLHKIGTKLRVIQQKSLKSAYIVETLFKGGTAPLNQFSLKMVL